MSRCQRPQRKPRARKARAPRAKAVRGVPPLPAAAPGRIVCVYLSIATTSALNERGSTKWKGKRDARVRGKVAHELVELFEAHGLKRRKCTIVLTRVSAGVLDSDNIWSSQKRVRDGVSDAIEIDDGDAAVTWVVDQIKAPKDISGVYVEAYEPGAGAREMLARGEEWVLKHAHALDVVLPILRRGAK